MDSNETKIKTNAPFTIKRDTKIFFCPEAKESKSLRQLIDIGGERNKTIPRTLTMASTASVLTRNGKTIIHKKNISYLLIGDEITKETVKELASGFDSILLADTNYVFGHRIVLVEEVSKETVHTAITTFADSAESDYIVFYLSCNGIKDIDGKYHYILSNLKNESTNGIYTNTLSVDTLNTYIEHLESEGKAVYVFIDTNHPDDLAQNIYYLDNSCAYLWSQKEGDNHDGISLALSIITEIQDHEAEPECSNTYFIKRKDSIRH